MSEPQTVKLCLLGFGNVAREFCILAEDKREALAADGLRVLVSAAGTRHASFLDPQGVTPGRLLELARDGLPSPPLPAAELLGRSGAGVLVEATVMEDERAPIASGHIETAFRLGMDAITVNKGPVAWQFTPLQELADRLGRRWRYEGTVADGMPVFGLLEFCLRHCDVRGFDAIFNATTNFIIEAVGEGRDFADALAQVQAEGYAEADPSHDIDGVDAACKTAALANVAMGAGITPDDIAKESIRGITPERVRAAAADGHKLCVLCSAARRPDGSVGAAVRLTEIELDHPLAPVKGSSLGVVLHTDLMADVVVAEMAALVPQTAYAIYADLLALRSPAG
jgi:homoserine dehydrogenase